MRRPVATPWSVPLLLALLVSGCGKVVFELDDDAGSSSTTSVATTGGTGATSGAGGAGPTSSSASGDASGGAGGEGGGGGSDVEPVVACPELAWLGEPLVQDLHDDAAVPGALLVEPVRYDGKPYATEDTIALLATYVERDDDVLTRNMRSVDLFYPWQVASGEVDPGGAFLGYRYAAEWTSLTELPTPLAAGRGGFGAYPVERSSEAGVNERLENGGAPLPGDVRDVRDLAWTERGFYAAAHGPLEAPRFDLVAPMAGAVATSTPVAPCADRPVAVDVEPYRDGFLVAAATTCCSNVCDPGAPPTAVRVTRVDDHGALQATTLVSLGGAVAVDVRAHTTASGAWIAVRTDRASAALVFRVEGEASPFLVGEIPLAADRALTLSTRGDDLVVVDTGPPTADEPAVRVRTFDAALRPIAATPELPGALLAPTGRPAVHVRGDGAGILALTFDQLGDEHHALVALRAVCVAAEAP